MHLVGMLDLLEKSLGQYSGLPLLRIDLRQEAYRLCLGPEASGMVIIPPGHDATPEQGA